MWGNQDMTEEHLVISGHFTEINSKLEEVSVLNQQISHTFTFIIQLISVNFISFLQTDAYRK